MAMFQHRHYREIAKILADAKEARTSLSKHVVIEDLENQLIKLFQSDNPGFSESRFRAASSKSEDMHRKDK